MEMYACFHVKMVTFSPLLSLISAFSFSYTYMADQIGFVDSHMHLWDVVNGPHEAATLGGPAELHPNYDVKVSSYCSENRMNLTLASKSLLRCQS
jgi:hypothetical protein